MQEFEPSVLKKLYKPASDSHKGQNGKVLIIAGSTLFHAASLWPLTVASRIVDMVFYASVPENNEIVAKNKEDFRNGIVVSRSDLEYYIKEADCILVGPGLERTEEKLRPAEDYDIKNFSELSEIENSGIQTYYLTKHLLKNYPDKRYVIDGGALQMMEEKWLLNLTQVPILTPHKKEFERLFNFQLPIFNFQSNPDELNKQIQESVVRVANEFNCIVLLKGEKDIVCSPTQCVIVSGGNAGMTKGGTGDVLAGLVVSLYAKNEAFISACSASYINKKAGESLFEKVGLYFNASDLANEIPKVMGNLA